MNTYVSRRRGHWERSSFCPIPGSSVALEKNRDDIAVFLRACSGGDKRDRHRHVHEKNGVRRRALPALRYRSDRPHLPVSCRSLAHTSSIKAPIRHSAYLHAVHPWEPLPQSTGTSTSVRRRVGWRILRRAPPHGRTQHQPLRSAAAASR